MKVEELEKVMSGTQTKGANRFDLEEALMGMYRVSEDLTLALDHEERMAVARMHTMRVDSLFDVFEDMVNNRKIL